MSFLAQATHNNHSTAPSKKRNKVSDEIMIPRVMVIASVVALVFIGVLMVFSAGSISDINILDKYKEQGITTLYLPFWLKQLAFAIMGGLGCAFLVGVFSYDNWRGFWGNVFLVVVLALIVLTFFLGGGDAADQWGANRWIDLGFFSLQISEFAKIVFVLMTAKFVALYHENQISGMQCFGSIMGYVVAPLMFLFLAQRDLGTTAICMVGILAVLLIAELPMRVFALIGVIGTAFGALAIAMEPYRLARLMFWDASSSSGASYQVNNAVIAFAQGGIFGKGIGASSQKYGALPECHTDMIFAVLGEEMGLIGTFLVVALFVILLIGGLRVAMNATDMFGRCIAAGLVIMLVFQAFLNMACVMGIFPTTGKPLPFLSYGGSSMIASLMTIGILLSVSFASNETGSVQRRRDNLRLIQSDSGYSRSRRHQQERRGGFDAPSRYRMEAPAPRRGGNLRLVTSSRPNIRR